MPPRKRNFKPNKTVKINSSSTESCSDSSSSYKTPTRINRSICNNKITSDDSSDEDNGKAEGIQDRLNDISYKIEKLDRENQYTGRGEQYRTVRDEITKSLLKPITKGLYLYGPSGTGKTTVINLICSATKIPCVMINCSGFAVQNGKGAAFVDFFKMIFEVLKMSLNDETTHPLGRERHGERMKVSSVLNKLDLAKLCGTKAGIKEIFQWIEFCFMVPDLHFRPCLVFDEIESLLELTLPKSNVSLSHYIIHLSTLKDFKIRIISIGNDLYLTDSIPKSLMSKSAVASKVEVVGFPSYTLEETKSIVMKRMPDDAEIILKACGLNGPKLDLAIRKTFTSANGDIRLTLRFISEIIKHAAKDVPDMIDENRWKTAFEKMKTFGGSSVMKFSNQILEMPWRKQVVLVSVVTEYTALQRQLRINEAIAAACCLASKMKVPEFDESEFLRIVESLAQDG